MAHILAIRTLTPAEFRRVNELIEEAPTARQRRKAQAVVLYDTGMNARDIATALGVHPHTIYADLQAFAQRGLASIQEAAPRGAPPRIDVRQTEGGPTHRPDGPRGSGGALRPLVAGDAANASDSPSHPPRHQPGTFATTAQKRGIHWRHIQRKLICADPQRPAILARIRALGRHLPPGSHLLFFDVKPVTVKAYGGARYTAQRRLVLGRRQRTRGRFYLFLVYEVTSGKVHWRHLPGKDSTWVCRFMRQVRRWYPRGEIWLALDQDSPHPQVAADAAHDARVEPALRQPAEGLSRRQPGRDPL